MDKAVYTSQNDILVRIFGHGMDQLAANIGLKHMQQLRQVYNYHYY